MIKKLISKLQQPSSLAGIAAIAALMGHDGDKWAQGAAAVFGVLAVLVDEGGAQ